MSGPTAPPPLPETFAVTTAAMHALAEHVLCVPRHVAVGRVGLVATPDGVATPPFGPADRVVALQGTELVDRDRSGERRAPITTLRAAGEFVGVTCGVPGQLWTPVTDLVLDDPLVVDAVAVDALATWYAFVTEALAGLARAGAELEPLTLWPEGFDLATTGGAVNYGGTTGDGFSAQPYLYVGPHAFSTATASAAATGGELGAAYWNAPFGSALRYDEIESLESAVDFLVRGFRLATS